MEFHERQSAWLIRMPRVLFLLMASTDLYCRPFTYHFELIKDARQRGVLLFKFNPSISRCASQRSVLRCALKSHELFSSFWGAREIAASTASNVAPKRAGMIHRRNHCDSAKNLFWQIVRLLSYFVFVFDENKEMTSQGKPVQILQW